MVLSKNPTMQLTLAFLPFHFVTTGLYLWISKVVIVGYYYPARIPAMSRAINCQDQSINKTE